MVYTSFGVERTGSRNAVCREGCCLVPRRCKAPWLMSRTLPAGWQNSPVKSLLFCQRITRLSRVGLTRARAVSTRDHYAVLQVPDDATLEDVKAAFRRQARRLHPDVNKEENAEEKFVELKAAYEIICKMLVTGQGSARAADPRFARYERWRSECLPGLRMQIQLWQDEIDQFLAWWTDDLTELDAQLEACFGGEGCAGEDAIAAIKRAEAVADTGPRHVQQQIDVWYEQVAEELGAYPVIAWIDVWEEASQAWNDKANAEATLWLKKFKERQSHKA